MTDENPMDGAEHGEDERAALAALDPFAATLRDGAVWAEPPAELGDRIVAAVEAAQAAPGARRAPRARWWRVALPAAAAAIVAFAAGLWFDRDTDDDAAIAVVSLAATDIAPDAAAEGEVFDRGAGYAIRLDVDGLAPAAAGEFYEGWLISPDGDWVSVGTFHLRGGDGTVVLWSGVPIADYDTLCVTSEVEGDGAGYDPDRIVLKGKVSRR